MWEREQDKNAACSRRPLGARALARSIAERSDAYMIENGYPLHARRTR
jgi:hypothetical protein